MHEAARPASTEDLARLVVLAGAAVAELTSTKGGAVWARRDARQEPVDVSLAAALADDDQLVVVGTFDGFVLGYASTRLERLNDGGLLGVIDDVFVEPDGRGVGIGEAMLEVVLAWCRGRGCLGVDALALPGNRATKNFFESFGLVARAIVVHRSLTEAPAGAPTGAPAGTGRSAGLSAPAAPDGAR